MSTCPDCDHSPYDSECDDTDYQRQPCCGLIVHIDDLGDNDFADHTDECNEKNDR